MTARPDVGAAGGQKYPVLRSIQTFLAQMAEGGAQAAPTVLKELLQNADDAKATEVSVVLDERSPPLAFSQDYTDLLAPALLVRNNRSFRLKTEVKEGDVDDFSAICDVASGHKRTQATAAGRFGIGFNSVYFLTDTPVLFSRREVHVFDLLHKVFDADGWRFPLDQFPARSASLAGAVKAVLEWCLPKAVLGSRTFGDLALDPSGDYGQTVFRLPLRRSQEGTPSLYDDRFPEPAQRQRALIEMADEAARSIVFLKNVCRISFGVLRDREVEPLATIDASACPPAFFEFLDHVEQQDQTTQPTEVRSCTFDRTISRAFHAEVQDREASSETWRFHVRHVARFDDERLAEARARLHRNKERAVPWAAVAVPLNREACRFDGAEVANWRVFLPLLEEGPSACLLSGAFFIGPSRQRTEYRLTESDEGSRRTAWNQLLVQQALVDLLRDVSADLPDLAPELLEKHPKEYVSLFPATVSKDSEPTNLTDFARRCFAEGVWALHLRDIWNDAFGLLVGDVAADAMIDMAPEWLLAYRDRFRELSNDRRRFLRYALGDALSSRIGRDSGITIRRGVQPDVALLVLRHPQAPETKDLPSLLKLIADRERPLDVLDGVWAFASSSGDGLLRFAADALYVLDEPGDDPIVAHLRQLMLPLVKTQWVRKDVGLPGVLEEFGPGVENVVRPSTASALELLRRLPADNPHDQQLHDYDIGPVVDFLVRQLPGRLTPDLRLGFLVRTAHQKEDRRRLGVILLKPSVSTREDEALWAVWFRRLFAEVDPGFAKEIHRLLDAHPGCLEMLHADECRVAVARVQETLAILHQVRLNEPGVYEGLEREIANASENHPDAATLVAITLLEAADAKWESLDDDQRYTVLSLPIHRRSDGRFVPLVPAINGDVTRVRQAFRLQTQDDIEDAPLELPTCELLQTANSTVKRFYRRQLGLEEHGRVSILKDVLRQIGNSTPASRTMLRYLVRYYDESLTRLEHSGDEGELQDAHELRDLFASARWVPCIDGTWETATAASEGWQVADQLVEQGWPQERLAQLLPQLYPGEHIASIEPPDRELVRHMLQLASKEPRDLACLAVTSASPDLLLVDRVRVLTDNFRDFPDAGVEPAPVALQAQVPVLGGRTTLALAERIDEQVDLPIKVLRVLAPSAVDVPDLARELGLKRDDLRRVLDAFRVGRRSARDLDDRLVQRFAEVWPELNEKERLSVLGYVGTRSLANRLANEGQALDSVLVASRPPTWQKPPGILSPRWSATNPPHLPPASRPFLDRAAESVRKVWDEWNGVKSFDGVLGLIVETVGTVSASPRAATPALYRWIETAVGTAPSTEELLSLQERPWVLSQRGDSVEFKRPREIVLHPGERILAARFSVPALPLPGFVRPLRESLGFQFRPPAQPETLVGIGDSLAERASTDAEAAVKVYGLVEEILDQSDGLDEVWEGIARRLPVYRVFRSDEQQLTSLQLFLGDGEYKDDLSGNLLCLKAGGALPKGLISHYRRLGVFDRPTVGQVLAALATFSEREGSARTSHARLLRTLQEVAGDAEVLDESLLGEIRVPTCAGSFKPLRGSYWDDDFGRRDRVLPEHARLLIDTTDKPTQKLLDWLRQRGCGPVTLLREAGELELIEEPLRVEMSPEVSFFLLPWKQWVQELAREESALRESISNMGLSLPGSPLEVIAVDRTRVRCRLADGQVVEQAADWEGPQALAVASGRVFVRIPSEANGLPNKDWVNRLDIAIAREIAILLGGASTTKDQKSCMDEILATLERPSTVLRRLRETYRQHFLHQYHDQVADPKFAELFEEYERTSHGSKRAAELEERMYGLLEAGFVQARREQIRGYGYDELSVFAELLQNAEDSYVQRARLNMDMPSPCSVVFRYIDVGDERRVLEFTHRGRPFNYWQHGARQDRNLSRDVEGVLRSAGSFKPHTVTPAKSTENAPTIGRFGLGFKSVYLLTDRPEIHSGSWHFAIEAGCLPTQLPPPIDLEDDVTRIRLPLRGDVEMVEDSSQLLDLLPFLRMITRLELHTTRVEPLEISISAEALLESDQFAVDRVTVHAPDVGHDGTLRFLRCRTREHAGQLALLLAQDGGPARWDEAFGRDLFVVLPLRAELGCGVAASHRFEVQSGRTHLVDPKTNALMIDQVAALLPGLVDGLRTHASDGSSSSEFFRRFWPVWRWDRGDGECLSLRKALAAALAGLAERVPIVPTMDPQALTSLANGPRFFFWELPDAFRDAIVGAQVSITAAGVRNVPLAATKVVADGFAVAYRRACECAGVRPSEALVRVGWDEVAVAFRERAWFAEKPELLSCLAEAVNEDQSRKVGAWLALCRVLGADGDGNSLQLLPGDLLAPDFPGKRHLPTRFLKSLAGVYGEAALRLLQDAHLLRPRLSEEDLRQCVQADDLTAAEGIGILRYLAEEDRFREYWDLQGLFRSHWFPEAGGRLTTKDASERKLIPVEVLANEVFRTWLGLGGDEGTVAPPEPAVPPPDPKRVLDRLYAWWQVHGVSWISEYEGRLYPSGRRPTLRAQFHSKDLAERREWVTLFLLASLHSMGRTQLEQHRDFLRRCEQKGWLDVFADGKHEARRWMEILDSYLDDLTGSQEYLQWMKQFVVIYQISRWLPDYVDSFLNVDRLHRPFALDEIIAPRTSAIFSGGGPDAPALTNALRIGACFVFRELMRLGLLSQPHAHRYCYVPSRRVCGLLEALGCPNLQALPPGDRSSGIHRFLVEHLGEERAIFNSGFDLPLMALAEDADLQGELLGTQLVTDDDVSSAQPNVG